MTPPYDIIVCLPVILIKRLYISIFLLMKLKNKTRIVHTSFWMYYWKTYTYIHFFFSLNASWIPCVTSFLKMYIDKLSNNIKH